MSRRKLSLLALALASAALSACASPTAPQDNGETPSCRNSGGVLGGSGTYCNAPISGGVLGGSGT